MRRTILVAFLVVVGVDVGFSKIEETLIGPDGVVRPPYNIYEPNIADYCVSEDCKKYYRRRNKEYECEENEVYHKANVTNHCGLGCPSGCYCKPGYVKLKRSEPCVPVEETDIVCKENEVLGCGKFDCQPYCDIGQDPLCYQNRYSCRTSYHCFCKPGYIRIDGGECVKLENCIHTVLEDAVEEKKFKAKSAKKPIPFNEQPTVGANLF